jgi:hypothetical protein
MLTGALFPLLPLLSRDLGLSESMLTIAIGLSDRAYAFGTVLTVQFARGSLDRCYRIRAARCRFRAGRGCDEWTVRRAQNA